MVRNRIIEYIEMISEFYINRPPFDLSEILCQWEDWVPQPWNKEHYTEPPYTSEEIAKIRSINNSWENLCDKTPRIIFDEQEVLESNEWKNFVNESKLALETFMKRGKLKEEP